MRFCFVIKNIVPRFIQDFRLVNHPIVFCNYWKPRCFSQHTPSGRIFAGFLQNFQYFFFSIKNLRVFPENLKVFLNSAQRAEFKNDLYFKKLRTYFFISIEKKAFFFQIPWKLYLDPLEFYLFCKFFNTFSSQ